MALRKDHPDGRPYFGNFRWWICPKMGKTLVNVNQPVLGPNNGFIAGNYSHCFSSGGSAGTGGSFSGGDIGGYPNNVGLGVAATLGTTHYIKYSLQRRISSATGGNGL